MNFPVYKATLDRKKMTKDARYGYEAYYSLRARSKKNRLTIPDYTARDFISWWLYNLKTFKGSVPTCGRIDHKKGYEFNNIMMQDMCENSREGILRNKTNIKTAIKYGKKIIVSCKKTGKDIAIVPSIRETALLFNVSQRLIQFLVRGKYKQTAKINFNLRSAN